MACANCGRPNPEDAAFCSRCGAPLTERCGRCGRVNPPDGVFCTGCGTKLAGGDEPQVRERRYLTVMFCDLVDSTRLAGELDPEDMRDLVAAYQTACARAIADHSGFLARYLGDGVLAYFGYPEAHEDDARLAVAAGLAIVGSVGSVRSSCGREDIEVRVGLHTGEVVVTDAGGGDGRHQHEIVGETPNVAARLQSATVPGSVIISDRTRALVEGFFAFESMGELTLKGVRRPVPAFQVTGRTEARTRLDAVASRGLTPFVGRDAELAELVRQWEAVAGGDGRVALVSGEPGIGKSRLAHELCGRASEAGGVVRLRCSPYNESSTLFPFVEYFLKAVCGREPDQARRLERLEARLADIGLDADATVPLVADLLAIPTAGRYPPSSDSPVRLKRRTLEALFAWVSARSAGGPLLLLIDDVQWVDPTTLELLGRFFEHEPVPRVLLLLTHRPDFLPPWAHRAHVHHVALDRLEAEAMHTMLAELTGGRTLPAPLAAEIGARTDGVPLFVEEVTHAVLESGFADEDATLPRRLVPSTLRESLLARLDRLGEARAVAQVLSVVGREAPFELLRAVSELDDSELEAGLERLVETDLVRLHHSPAGTGYALKHWLLEDVAYESLLRSSRRRYHRAIAEALPRELPEVVDTQPEFVAHHLLEAGQVGDAIAYLMRAGEQAHRRSANTEAIAHISRALELVRTKPESPERLQLELTLLIALGAPLTAARGYSAPEVEEAYTRAGELCRAAGDDATPQFFRALYGTWRVHLLRADYARALEFAHQLLRLADNPTQEAAAHRAIGSTLFYLGEDPGAHLEIVIGSTALERSRMSFIEELHDVVDPWITCHAYQAWALWLAGRATDARAMSDRALALGKELGHPFTRTLTLSFDGWLCQWQGDSDAVRERARDALALAREQGFEFWIGWNEVMLGWADGDLDAIRLGLEDWRALGSELGTTYFLALLAKACRDAGRLDEAWEALAAADEVAARTGERFWASDVRRLRGDLMASAS